MSSFAPKYEASELVLVDVVRCAPLLWGHPGPALSLGMESGLRAMALPANLCPCPQQRVEEGCADWVFFKSGLPHMPTDQLKP